MDVFMDVLGVAPVMDAVEEDMQVVGVWVED